LQRDWLIVGTAIDRKPRFQAEVQRLRRDARERLKAGTPKAEALRFFKENHLGGWSDKSKAWGHVYTLRGCGRGIACAIGPDGGRIDIEVNLDEKGNVNSEPVVTQNYAGYCS
jgi:hypothetical protein